MFIKKKKYVKLLEELEAVRKQRDYFKKANQAHVKWIDACTAYMGPKSEELLDSLVPLTQFLKSIQEAYFEAGKNYPWI